ncbi:MAG: trypsin-like serine protease [Candidatus Dojkabacteria bacterium]
MLDKIRKSPLTALLVLGLIGVGVGAAILINVSLQQKTDVTPEDTSALFGGQLEASYPFAGFMVSYDEENQGNLCGFALIAPTTGVTAAHCIDNGSSYFAGVGEFTTNPSNLAEVSDATQLPGWNGQTSTNDLAVFNLEASPPDSTQFAVRGEVDTTCRYRVVAYGRTEDDTAVLSLNRPRKSARICINEINENTLKVTGLDGGLCLGDSGSPIFEDGTNNLVGVVSSIQSANNNQSPCFVANTGFAVRVDTNIEFITASGNITEAEFATGSLNESNVLAEVPTATPVASLPQQTLSFEQIQPGHLLVGGGIALISVSTLLFYFKFLKKL